MFDRASLTLTSQDRPRNRFIAGADAIGTAEQHIAKLRYKIDADRDLSTSLALDAQVPPGPL